MPLYDILATITERCVISALDIDFSFAKYSDFTTDNLVTYFQSTTTDSALNVGPAGQIFITVDKQVLVLKTNIKSLFNMMFTNYFNEYVPDFSSKSDSEKDEILNELSNDFFEFIKNENKKYIEDVNYNHIIYGESCSNYFSENYSKLNHLFIYLKLKNQEYIDRKMSLFVALPLYVDVKLGGRCIAKEYVIFHTNYLL